MWSGILLLLSIGIILAKWHRRKGVPCKMEGKVFLVAAMVGYLLEVRVGLLIVQNGKGFVITTGSVAIFGNDVLGNIRRQDIRPHAIFCRYHFSVALCVAAYCRRVIFKGGFMPSGNVSIQKKSL